MIAGHNSINSEDLKGFIGRIERLEEEKKALAEDIKLVYREAAGTGYDPKIMRKIIMLRRRSKREREMENEILNVYLAALGME